MGWHAGVAVAAAAVAALTAVGCATTDPDQRPAHEHRAALAAYLAGDHERAAARWAALLERRPDHHLAREHVAEMRAGQPD